MSCALGLGLLSTLAFYAAYAWILVRAVHGAISLGDMTMYLLVFKQGQSALAAILSAIGGMYEDNLYLSNLYEFLGHKSAPSSGDKTQGPDPSDAGQDPARRARLARVGRRRSTEAHRGDLPGLHSLSSARR